MPELAFVLGSASASPLTDLVEALAAEVSKQDAVATVGVEFPEFRQDRVAVVFDGESGVALDPGTTDFARTIAVVTAAPGSPGFDGAIELALRAGSAFHVNSACLEHLFAAGVPARHLQLGFSSGWPRSDASADGLAVIGGNGYFAWPEALAAVHRGDVILHERSLGMAPMIAGRHLFVAAPESRELVADILRRDDERLATVREQANAFVREALPLALAGSALIGAARVAVAQPPMAPEGTSGQPAA